MFTPETSTTMNPRTYKKHDSKVSGKCTKCNNY